MAQGEIEFLPVPVEEAADQVVLAKWVLREVAYTHGLEVSFAPKIIVGQAGSGFHVHTRLMKDGVNAFVEDGDVSGAARKVIAGYLMCARSLTAFGNTVSTSYLRLVPDQEAPTRICWGRSNRSVLVRVPLGWTGDAVGMARHANPVEPGIEPPHGPHPQTVEVRSGDGSANVHFYMAAMTVAARYGLEHPDSLALAQRLLVDADASSVETLEQLPASCVESGRALQQDRSIYTQDDVFPAKLIDSVVQERVATDDEGLSERLFGDEAALAVLVRAHLHCG